MCYNYLNVFKNLEFWLERSRYESHDRCDVYSLPFYLFISDLSNNWPMGKYISFPFMFLADRYANLLRKIFRIDKNLFPQAQAIIARAFFKNAKVLNKEEYLEKGLNLINWLEKNSSNGYDYLCWGQPYDWYSKKVIKACIPRTTVTSQTIGAFLDAYELTNNPYYLKIAENACHFYIKYLNYKKDDRGDLCFSYTTEDSYHIHNANILASSALLRTWFHCKNDELKEFGIKALNFTIKYQNNDGSWFYWAPPDKIKGKIDNYHTGFILESLQNIKKYLGNKFEYNNNLKKGIKFYKENFFEGGMIPKMTPTRTYPIDIQSCAQSIITLGELANDYKELKEKLIKVADWTIKNMLDKDGFFYFRIYKDARIDKTPYIRWSESWMLRALSYLIN